MENFVIFCLIFITSLFLAVFSMRDLNVSKDFERENNKKRKKGTIVFTKDKVIHYSSNSSFSSSKCS